MARATLAPVIGRPASSSQKSVCRYSSSAMVASAIWRQSLVGLLPSAADGLGTPKTRGALDLRLDGGARGARRTHHLSRPSRGTAAAALHARPRRAGDVLGRDPRLHL